MTSSYMVGIHAGVYVPQAVLEALQAAVQSVLQGAPQVGARAGGLQWWCSARGIPWRWAWQPYPGVWLLVLAVAAGYWRVSRWRVSSSRWSRWHYVWHRVSGWGGVLLTWLALDWPLGPLAAGYLASAHAVQFIALAMIAPFLLLLGLDGSAVEARLATRYRLQQIVNGLTHPVVAAVLFTVVMIATHTPGVVDTLMHAQVGAFALDTTWLISGLIFWWPVILPRPAESRFGPPLKMLYLFAGTQAHLYIAVWLLLAEFPAYSIYELAPRVTALSALEDQQVAGGLLLTGGSLFVLGVISVIFFSWVQAEEDDSLGWPDAGCPDPVAIERTGRRRASPHESTILSHWS